MPAFAAAGISNFPFEIVKGLTAFNGWTNGLPPSCSHSNQKTGPQDLYICCSGELFETLLFCW